MSQFADAMDDSTDDDFVALMQKKVFGAGPAASFGAPQPPSAFIAAATLVSPLKPSAVEQPPPAAAVDDDDQGDYGDFDEYEDYDDEDDYNGGHASLHSALLNERSYSSGPKSSAAMSSVPSSKLNTSHRGANDVSKMEKMEASGSVRHQGRDDRATSEQVLDPRTRLILFKLLSNGFLNKIDGCLSTGKEANVYYASSPSGAEYAVKVYKTSILVFKDRDKYVSGEHR